MHSVYIFLKVCQELQIFSVTKEEKTYCIYWPELIELADEYSKKVVRRSRQYPDTYLDIVEIQKKKRKDNKDLGKVDTSSHVSFSLSSGVNPV